MAGLAKSSQTVVGIVFLVMTLERWLPVPFLRLVKWFCLELYSPTILKWTVARVTGEESIIAARTIPNGTCPGKTVGSEYLGLMTQRDYGRLLPAQAAIIRTFGTFLLRVHGGVEFC